MSNSQYLISEDQRISKLRKQFEELVNMCPADFNPWQTFKTVKKPGCVIVEVVSTFKIEVDSG